MRLLDRYLLRELLTWLGFCLVGMVVFALAFDLLNSLNRIQEHHLLVSDVIELYLVKLPSLLVFPLLPITLLLALLCALTNHTRHHELVAMRAAGIGLWRLCLPYMVIGVLLSLVVLALNETFVPDSEMKQEQIMDRRSHQNAARADTAIERTSGFSNLRDNRNWVWDSFNFNTGVMLNPKLDWVENGVQWTLFARQAERVNGVWTFYGGLWFTTNDFLNPDSLAALLNHPTNVLSQFLAVQLSTNTQKLLAHCMVGTNCTAGTNAALKRALANDLNRIIRKPLYEASLFADVKLPAEILDSADLRRRGSERLIFNRTLLIEALPQEFSRNSLNAVVMSRVGSFAHYTNRLSMPQFTETPRDFAIEAKFNQRSQALKAETAGIPIMEILEYLKLHPNLGEKTRHRLLMQLHGRIAGPWSCLVVVFIAIPFGAASGRRNIFAGVAGSIVVCFAYFILLKVALWLGTGGVMPEWMAAWLPNAVFGISGFWLMLRVR
ncbi:MAG TPA: LptF/LptG family permease [Verrucomicrobiae bacterium]|nr:LptF/LptG family permease [Verrucomicrobiae bacterium]